MSTVEDFVVRIPVSDFVKIIEGVRSYQDDEAPVTEVEAIKELMNPWAIVVRDVDGSYFTHGFIDHKSCAAKVASFYNTEYQVIHVLKNGIPRKKITVEVNARFR